MVSILSIEKVEAIEGRPRTVKILGHLDQQRMYGSIVGANLVIETPEVSEERCMNASEEVIRLLGLSDGIKDNRHLQANSMLQVQVYI